MNRTFLTLASIFGPSSLLLLDSAQPWCSVLSAECENQSDEQNASTREEDPA